ncbi:type VI secretion system protein TssA [Photobacterium atrarenae]|uniref:Type VI secretion system protein TssA n=1 Tax=Photobacterium atrarenae TaxID=865757 RepID=A0ABY5GBD3_9GAMM|nr:type VI secretion system protein TssA [Photobacterium atrarenae]UTV26496.1 type VI secretion system protein TssA [Photobacterium atrarenae]
MDNIQLDFEGVLKPISAESQTGNDPRSDTSPHSPYYLLKDVRNQARAAERLALIDNEPLLSLSDKWRQILRQVPELLANEAKDLEYAAWYIEGLTRNYGFKGLGTGFKVARLLIEEFWDDLYPEPDEDGLETRISPLIGLNGVDGEGTLLMPISCIPLTELHNDKCFSLWEYEQAVDIERLDQDKRQQKIAAGGVSLKDVNDAVLASSVEFYQALYKDIEFSIQEFDALSAVMDRACGTPVPTSQITKKLNICKDTVEYLAADKLLFMTPNDENPLSEVSDEVVDHMAGRSDLSMALNSRSDAIDNLKLIAEFFKKQSHIHRWLTVLSKSFAGVRCHYRIY